MGYRQHLSNDRVLHRLMKQTGPVRLKRSANTFLFLCRSIIAQQLSTKVAAIIETRFLALLAENTITPDSVLHISIQRLRSIGLSAQKASYIHHVAAFYNDLQLNDEELNKLDDETLILLLTQIKGVGRWTVEMLLMFGLTRKDVFPLDDYGIRQSMIRQYDLSGKTKRELDEQLIRISAHWAPYRTYACLLLWKTRDNAK